MFGNAASACSVCRAASTSTSIWDFISGSGASIRCSTKMSDTASIASMTSSSAVANW